MSEPRDSSVNGDEPFLVLRYKSPAFAFAEDLRQIRLNYPDWPISKSFSILNDEPNCLLLFAARMVEQAKQNHLERNQYFTETRYV